MKVPGSTAHSLPVPAPSRQVRLDRETTSRSFDDVYRAYFALCCRWLRAMGTGDGEVEDVAQEVFVVVQRKLALVCVEDPAAWIYRIAWNTASDRRRRAFWRRLWARTAPLSEDEPALGPSPLEEFERRERVRHVRKLLARLPARRRTALVLFELLGYSGEEIAALEGIPVATVWTRLHHARRQFMALAESALGGDR